MRWRGRPIRELCESAPGTTRRGWFWPFSSFADSLKWAGFHPELILLAPLSSSPSLSPAEASPFLQSLSRRPDDPKSSRQNGSGAEAARAGRSGFGRGSDPEVESDQEPETDPENEGFALHSDDDGGPEDMATLVLDNAQVGSGLGLARGQGAVLTS